MAEPIQPKLVKPTLLQHVFARDWPLKAWLGGISILTTYATAQAMEPSLASFRDWSYCLFFGLVLPISPFIGFLLSLILASVLGPFYFLRARLNGAPFVPGDTVRILVGPSLGRVTQVYSLWQGDTLRVELGEHEKETYKDIFSPTQLARVTEQEGGGGAT